MATYRESGVDIDSANTVVVGINTLIQSTRDSASNPGKAGHFGGTYMLESGPDRLLVASADGIGTKLKVAIAAGGAAHARVGADLVNHCVDDLLACGAKALFFLDYVAMGTLQPDVLQLLVQGMTDACKLNGMALVGGETAEMPGVYTGTDYDVAGFIVGEVSPGRYIDGSAVRTGDVLLGWPSMGLHTNGYSLARSIVGLADDPDTNFRVLSAEIGDDLTLGDALLAGHPSYVVDVWPLVDMGIVSGMAHITGGGLVDNVPRMLPEGLGAAFDVSSWEVPQIMQYLILEGDVTAEERYRTFNMGIGFVAAVNPGNLEMAKQSSPGARVIGEVIECSPDEDSRVQGLF